MGAGIGLGIQAIGAGVGALGATMDEQRSGARKAELDNFITRLKSIYSPIKEQLITGNAPGGFLRGVYASQGQENATNMARQAAFAKRAKGSRTATTNAIAPDFWTGMGAADLGANIKGAQDLQTMQLQDQALAMPQARDSNNNLAAFSQGLSTVGSLYNQADEKGYFRRESGAGRLT